MVSLPFRDTLLQFVGILLVGHVVATADLARELPGQVVAVVRRHAVHRLAGDLVGVVPGIAGGAQHGRPLLQLHLGQPVISIDCTEIRTFELQCQRSVCKFHSHAPKVVCSTCEHDKDHQPLIE